MSNFACKTCGVHQIDSPGGYVEGCIHHPPHRTCSVDIEFGEGWVNGVWHNGGFAYSREAADLNKYVHPYRWRK